jgi:hypothetical protein
MTAMLIVVGFLVAAFAAALVIAEFADRRRSRELAVDKTRFNQPKPLAHPKPRAH